jgi:hypothetical protein
MRPRRIPRTSVIIQLIVLAFALLVALNIQTVLDDYALLTFHPSPQVAAIEAQLDLTPEAKAIFYRSKPQIDDKSSFNKDCETKPQELELGCYYQGRIYVLEISNASLAPEMEVVMAHELLHAAWARMSQSEHQTLGVQVEQVYRQLDDPSLQQRMAGYAKSEPGEQDNELHSILGTEYGGLPASLEQHYAIYFTDRQAIVEAHAAYKAIFDNQLTELNTDYNQIESEKSQLSTLDSQLQTYRSEGAISLYNSLVPRQNSMVDDINTRIAEYNQLKDAYNALAESLSSQQVTNTATSAQ